MLLAMLTVLTANSVSSAQVPKRHWLHSSALPPGAIGRQRLMSSGPLLGYTQPVKISAPDGVEIAAVSGGGFTAPRAGELLAGLRVGPVYRFKATGVFADKLVEVYPTVEVIGRLYPPPGKLLKFPVPVELTREELQMAAAGSFVTRVIYVEDPDQAIALEEPMVNGRREQQWFEARPDQDPLLVADTLGRPVAILRIGSRLPGAPVGMAGGPADPPIQMYDTVQAETPAAASMPVDMHGWPTPDGPGILTY